MLSGWQQNIFLFSACTNYGYYLRRRCGCTVHYCPRCCFSSPLICKRSSCLCANIGPELQESRRRTNVQRKWKCHPVCAANCGSRRVLVAIRCRSHADFLGGPPWTLMSYLLPWELFLGVTINLRTIWWTFSPHILMLVNLKVFNHLLVNFLGTFTNTLLKICYISIKRFDLLGRRDKWPAVETLVISGWDFAEFARSVVFSFCVRNKLM